MSLRYLGPIDLDLLVEPDTCTLRRCVWGEGESAVRLWQLWGCFARTTDGIASMFAIPVNIGGDPCTRPKPIGEVWGLRRVGPDSWQVSPSIRIREGPVTPGVFIAGAELVEVWHQTPLITGLVDDPGPP